MSHHAAIQVDWFGPFDDEGAAKQFAERRKLSTGLYVKIGKRPRQQGSARLKYIGISTRLTARLTPYHHKLPLITVATKIWVGEAGSFGLPKEKDYKGNRALKLAEWLHASYVKKSSSREAFSLSEQSTKGVTRDPATVINHWRDVRRESEEPYAGLKKAPHDWRPYIIDYCGSGHKYRGGDFKPEARLTWLDGSFKLVRLSK